MFYLYNKTSGTYLLTITNSNRVVTTTNKHEAMILYNPSQVKRYCRIHKLHGYEVLNIETPIPDECNPRLIFSSIPKQLLALVAANKIDVVKLAKAELEDRGVDTDLI
ncbi:MAG: hypothetical protein JNL32_02390 [Candidatus Kapabacteria bacterium]|nr:hypothetical protein [Candidatus Kapabacteria bacterium]